MHRRRELELAAVVGAVGVLLGLAADRAPFTWNDPRHSVLDLAVGLAFVAAGMYAISRRPMLSVLLTATGFAWFLGSFWSPALYLHRGALVCVVIAYPDGRHPSRLGLATIAAGCAVAVASPVWGNEPLSAVLAACLVGVIVREHLAATGRARRQRLVATQVGVAWGVAMVGGSIAQLVVASGNAVEPTLVVYQGVLIVGAIALVAAVRAPTAGLVVDLMVELGDAPAVTLRDSLARTLRDPTLQLGYWSPIGGFVDVEGRPVPIPPAGDDRCATFVERESLPFAVLVHDASVLDQPALVDAVTSAARLSAANANLRAEVLGQVAELTASRRRLLTVADEERQRLESRLHDGAERRVRPLLDVLVVAAEASTGEAKEHVERAETHLIHALNDLGELARGLHPRELRAGLGQALAAVAERCPVPVELDVTSERFNDEIEATIYYVCAEALANVAKHAAASHVAVHVSRRSDQAVVVIVDDGAGGAYASGGSGLRGLVDRVDTLGGTFVIDSPRGATMLVAELPLGTDAS